MGRITVTELAERLGVTRQRAHALCEYYGVRKEVKPIKIDGRTSYVATVLESSVRDRIPVERPNGAHRK